MFSPQRLTDRLRQVGGVEVVFALIEKCTSPVHLHKVLRALIFVLQGSPKNYRRMLHSDLQGYGMLSALLQTQPQLLDENVLELFFNMGTCPLG